MSRPTKVETNFCTCVLTYQRQSEEYFFRGTVVAMRIIAFHDDETDNRGKERRNEVTTTAGTARKLPGVAVSSIA